MIKFSVMPVLKKFFIDDENLSLKMIKRGMPPLGGGVIQFSCPVLKTVKAFQWLDVGKIKKIRGTAYTCRGPPNTSNRIIESAKGEFLKYLPDVYFTVDNSKGLSPGNKFIKTIFWAVIEMIYIIMIDQLYYLY